MISVTALFYDRRIFMKKIAAAIAALLAVSMALSSCSSGSENSSESPAKETSLPQTELQDMRDITASELVSEMKTGFSLGNTMDSTIGKNNGEPYEYETGWGNQATTREAIQGIADSGFNVLRVPVSWGEHLSSDGSYTIDKAWLDRVNEIVDYGLDAGMFVILNTHHEEWLFPDEAHFEANSEELAKLWSQIAERFSGYNEKLIFEGLNEPRKRDTIYEWNGGDEEGQQDERRRDPLGQAGELGVERGRLTLAEIVVGIAGERAETVLLAGLEQDDRSQSNAGDELQNEKNDL